MQANLDMPHFRDSDSGKSPFRGYYQGLGKVRIGKGTVTPLAFETRETRLLSVFDAAKKGLIRLIETAQCVLKNVDM